MLNIKQLFLNEDFLLEYTNLIIITNKCLKCSFKGRRGKVVDVGV